MFHPPMYICRYTCIYIERAAWSLVRPLGEEDLVSGTTLEAEVADAPSPSTARDVPVATLPNKLGDGEGPYWAFLGSYWASLGPSGLGPYGPDPHGPPGTILSFYVSPRLDGPN